MDQFFGLPLWSLLIIVLGIVFLAAIYTLFKKLQGTTEELMRSASAERSALADVLSKMSTQLERIAQLQGETLATLQGKPVSSIAPSPRAEAEDIDESIELDTEQLDLDDNAAEALRRRQAEAELTGVPPAMSNTASDAVLSAAVGLAAVTGAAAVLTAPDTEETEETGETRDTEDFQDTNEIEAAPEEAPSPQLTLDLGEPVQPDEDSAPLEPEEDAQPEDEESQRFDAPWFQHDAADEADEADEAEAADADAAADMSPAVDFLPDAHEDDDPNLLFDETPPADAGSGDGGIVWEDAEEAFGSSIEDALPDEGSEEADIWDEAPASLGGALAAAHADDEYEDSQIFEDTSVFEDAFPGALSEDETAEAAGEDEDVPLDDDVEDLFFGEEPAADAAAENDISFLDDNVAPTAPVDTEAGAPLFDEAGMEDEDAFVTEAPDFESAMAHLGSVPEASQAPPQEPPVAAAQETEQGTEQASLALDEDADLDVEDLFRRLEADESPEQGGNAGLDKVSQEMPAPEPSLEDDDLGASGIVFTDAAFDVDEEEAQAGEGAGADGVAAPTASDLRFEETPLPEGESMEPLGEFPEDLLDAEDLDFQIDLPDEPVAAGGGEETAPAFMEGGEDVDLDLRFESGDAPAVSMGTADDIASDLDAPDLAFDMSPGEPAADAPDGDAFLLSEGEPDMEDGETFALDGGEVLSDDDAIVFDTTGQSPTEPIEEEEELFFETPTQTMVRAAHKAKTAEQTEVASQVFEPLPEGEQMEEDDAGILFEEELGDAPLQFIEEEDAGEGDSPLRFLDEADGDVEQEALAASAAEFTWNGGSGAMEDDDDGGISFLDDEDDAPLQFVEEDTPVSGHHGGDEGSPQFTQEGDDPAISFEPTIMKDTERSSADKAFDDQLERDIAALEDIISFEDETPAKTTRQNRAGATGNITDYLADD